MPTSPSPRTQLFSSKNLVSYGSLAPYPDTTSGYSIDSADNPYAIFFPSLPEEIRLRRSATYNVIVNQMIPDGIHIYQYTSPLEIPLSFSLHWQDTSFCTNGPVTLLQLASTLHALALPIDMGGDNANLSYIANPVESKPAPGAKQAEGSDGAVKALTYHDADYYEATLKSYANQINFPPVCRLELMLAGQYGIRASGYIKEVDVALHGPWLQGEDVRGASTNQYRNMPTSADYSFVFVNVPTYTNRLDATVGTQRSFKSAMALDVATRLYDVNDAVRNQGSINTGVPTYGIPKGQN